MTRRLPKHCELCPKRCGANRAEGQQGVCGADDTLSVARAALHHWEEPPISGQAGSGTVFFANCPLRCVYCQNAGLAAGQAGRAITVERLADIFCEQQSRGALNINLVTPTHYVLQIQDALDLAKAHGLSIPIVYNTSGYETVETIRLLAGYIDIYLTDFKYVSSELSARYSHTPDYHVQATLALAEMVAQVGPYTLANQAESDDNGLLAKGVIVRHLLLPGCLADSKKVVSEVYRTYGDRVCLSLMNQYTPMPNLGDFPELRRTVSEEEYDSLIDYALELGVTNSFMQEGGTAEESFIPAFDGQGV